MKFLSLCSGIEAASVAWKPLGWSCVAVAEIEPFPCALLRHYWPAVPNLGDVSKITEAQVRALGPVDVVVFGFPCQDVSVAGQRKGLSDASGTSTRSGLFFDCLRIVEWAKPRWTVVENVPGLFSSNAGRDFGAVVGELAGCRLGVPSEGWRNAGAALGPKGLVEWAVLDAQFWGLAQRRERVFIVRDAGDWANRPPLFLERESMCWNPPPRREARQDVTPVIGGCSNGGGANGPGRDVDSCESLIRVAPTVEGRAGRSGANNFATSGGLAEVAPSIANRARGGGWPGTDEACDGALVATITKNYATMHGRTAGNNGGVAENQLIAHTLSAEGHDASEDGTGRGVPLVAAYGGNNTSGAIDVATAQAAHGGPHGRLSFDSETFIAHRMAVRRLTPREVERLMGFPDDYTLIPYRGKPACDGPRYRALGNSMAVPVMAWLGRRIALVASL